MKKSYWIKERNNPQFKLPYYITCDQLTKKEAREKEQSLYGYNSMREYKTIDEYTAAIAELKAAGFCVL